MRAARLAAPLDDRFQQFHAAAAVPDEVVVDHEGRTAPAPPAQILQLGHELGGRLRARPATVQRHDVAELAVVRATPARLHRHGRVGAHVDQVPARPRGQGEVGKAAGLVERLDAVRLHVGHEVAGEFLGLPHHDMVHAEGVRGLGGEQRPAADDGLARGMNALHQRGHGVPVDQHRADQHVVGPADVVVREIAGVGVDEAQIPLRRQHPGNGEQTQRRIRGALAHEPQGVTQGPEGFRCTRFHEEDLHTLNVRQFCVFGSSIGGSPALVSLPFTSGSFAAKKSSALRWAPAISRSKCGRRWSWLSLGRPEYIATAA